MRGKDLNAGSSFVESGLGDIVSRGVGWGWAAVSAITFALAGCESSPWPVGYLTETVGHATQTDVKGKLGAPNLTATASDGGTMWSYHYVRGWPGSATYECLEYALRFDQKGIFRSWVQTECVETAPDFALPDDQKP